MKDVEEVVAAWKYYIATISDWKVLTQGITPKQGGCGWIYELSNPIKRTNESFAIADMKDLAFAEPHYHPEEVTEIYFVLEGQGKVVLAGKVQVVEAGSVVVIPPLTAHFTIREGKDLVLATVNVPPFEDKHYIVVSETEPSVGFDRGQFDRLTAGRKA